jgi:Rod binding domain-containing protein
MSSLAAVTTASVGTNTAQSSPSRQRVTAAAEEFESVLVGQWLTNAESSFGTVPGSEEPDDPGASQMNEFAMQHLASEIVRKGGLGIAHLVEAGLMKSNTPSGSAAATIHASEIQE